jgi:hypothetical protein
LPLEEALIAPVPAGFTAKNKSSCSAPEVFMVRAAAAVAKVLFWGGPKLGLGRPQRLDSPRNREGR